MVLPNGNTIMVGEHMVKELARFGAVLSTARSIKTPPRELLNMPAPRKVVLPTLETTKVIEPAPEVIPAPIQADYPSAPEPIQPDTVQPVIPEVKKVVKKKVRK